MGAGCRAAVLAAVLALPLDASAVEELVGSVHPIADSPVHLENGPRIGEDFISRYVAYTTYEVLPGGGTGSGEVRLRRTLNGTAPGDPVQVSNYVLPRTDVLLDTDEGRVLFVRVDGSVFEELRLFDLPVLRTDVVPTDTAGHLFREARIDGTALVYNDRRYDLDGGVVFYLDSQVRPWMPEPISDLGFPASGVEIGSDWVVWSRLEGGDLDVVAWSRVTGATVFVSALPGVHEGAAATDGDFVVFRRFDPSTGAQAIDLVELPGGAPVTIVDNGAAVGNPSIDGDHVVYASNENGSFDLFVYRISDGRTFPAVISDDDTVQPHIRDNEIAFVRSDAFGDLGTHDVELLSFRIEEPPCDVDADGDVDAGDVDAIFAARGEDASGPDDPRDANRDGLVTVNDARLCALDCTLPDCESPLPACGLLGLEPLLLLAFTRRCWRFGLVGQAPRGELR